MALLHADHTVAPVLGALAVQDHLHAFLAEGSLLGTERMGQVVDWRGVGLARRRQGFRRRNGAHRAEQNTRVAPATKSFLNESLLHTGWHSGAAAASWGGPTEGVSSSLSQYRPHADLWASRGPGTWRTR